MNFLAHAYLSFAEKEILVGNMISDFVKGKERYTYIEGIQKGIQLHRDIDDFTDKHEATTEAKSFFKKDYRLYSHPIIDIVYDHFLANDETVLSENELLMFSQSTYNTIEQYSTHLPITFAAVFTYMKSENWLYNYKTPEGINKSLRGLVRRAKYMSDHRTAFELLQKHHQQLKNCYDVFFKDVKIFAKQSLKALMQ